MAVAQVDASYQNDGNYSQLDLQDAEFDGPLMRIETFRCSQPAGKFGVTAAGTPVAALAGQDHLLPASNRVFRHVFSLGTRRSAKVLLEIREQFDEDGAWEVRTRDVDEESASFGATLIAGAAPNGDSSYKLNYELRTAERIKAKTIRSPLSKPIAEQVGDLVDIGSPLEELGARHESVRPLGTSLYLVAERKKWSRPVNEFSTVLQRAPFATWARNVQVYERFGDFRDKCIHNGTNLTGKRPQLASEYVLIRAYRASLILLGRLFDPDMASGTEERASLFEVKEPLTVDPKPGVYTPFLQAYHLNLQIYQLGLDKAHSDYGGVPMKLKPGSQLENGAKAVASTRRANQTLADLALMFYGRSDSVAFKGLEAVKMSRRKAR